MCERSRNRVVQRIREFPRIDYRLNIFDARWTYGHIRLPALVADHRPADPFLSSTQLPLICPGIDRLLSSSEEHTSELQSLIRHSYAVFCLTKNISPHQLTNTMIN